MANITVPFMSTEESINNHIYFKVIEDVAEVIKADPRTIQVLHNNMEMTKTDLQDTAKTNIEGRQIITPADAILTVKVTEIEDADSVGTTIVNRRDSFPFFRDTDVGVSVAPVYIMTNLNFEFSYKVPSRSHLRNLRKLLRLHISRTKNTITHEIPYTMILPKYVERFIQDIHERKSMLVDIPFEQYFQAHTTNRMHDITDMINIPNIRWGVKEEQIGVTGMFGFDADVPDADNNKDTNEHTLVFDYTVQMEIPSYLTLSFPVMVANEIMPDHYIDILEEEANKRMAYYLQDYLHVGRSNTVLQYFGTKRMSHSARNPLYPINVPGYDDKNDFPKIPGYGTTFSFLVQLEDDCMTLGDLTDLPDYQIPMHLLNYIKKNKHKVCALFQSFLYIGLDQTNLHYSSDILEIDENMVIRSKLKLNKMRPCRITFSVCLDPGFLSETAKRDLKDDPDLFAAFLSEYTEVIQDFPVPDERVRRGRDETLLSMTVRALRQHMNNMDYDEVKRIVKIIGRNSRLTRLLGRQLTMGFTELYNDMVKERVCYVGHSGEVNVFGMNKNPMETEDEILLNRLIFSRGVLLEKDGTLPDEFSQSIREELNLNLPRTVMSNYILALRRD